MEAGGEENRTSHGDSGVNEALGWALFQGRGQAHEDRVGRQEATWLTGRIGGKPKMRRFNSQAMHLDLILMEAGDTWKF